MRFDIDMRDFAGPKMARISREMPFLIDKALRITVARHRRKMMAFARHNKGGLPRKAMLVGAAKQRVSDGTAGNLIKRRKHIHQSSQPFSGNGYKGDGGFSQAIEYRRNGRFVYSYGFMGGAEKWADLLARGLFMDPKTKVVGNTVTKSMRDYFASTGNQLKRSKTTLDYKKRPIVEEYLKRNHKRMILDFQNMMFGYYNRAMGKSDKVIRTKATAG